MPRKQIEEDRGTVEAVGGGPEWKQRERGNLEDKWVKRNLKEKRGRQKSVVSKHQNTNAFLGISIF